jgi:hypothetical protein
MLRRLQTCAYCIVERHRTQVVRVADALVERGFLSRAEIERLFAATPISDEPATDAVRAGDPQ